KTRELAQSNQSLQTEIADRQRVQQELLKLNTELELRVEERAADLLQTNTALQQVANELSESARRKDQFLAMLAHELRNPLAPIRNGLQLLRLSTGDTEIVEPALEMMERQVNQIVRLVDDLLDVSRISRGKIELRKERVELASIVRDAVESVGCMATAMEHNLVIDLPPEPIFVDVDPIRLTQLIGNLLNNACKFTERRGRISISVSTSGELVRLHVADSGIGIAADQLSRIFEMFTQVDTSLERTQSGLGIGLTLVKSLVEMHGGTVEAHSQGIGQGSEFIVTLAAVDRLEASDNTPACETKLPSALRILVVDDNNDAANSLAAILKVNGANTQTAYDGEEAVATAAKFRPNVVLLDIGLPKLNGFDAARKIRELPGGKDMILIALTGWGQEADRAKSIEAGFSHHLVKPVECGQLSRLLAELTHT
ncbi:MAG TPA: ATP-binding protein, partial [Lacipirellulaceae bacterium]|nr:ATP-binding protein [Lacipirellulaceae bacterium]